MTFTTVKSRFKKYPKFKIHLHKAFCSGNQLLDSLHKSFLNQTTLNLKKNFRRYCEKMYVVVYKIKREFIEFFTLMYLEKEKKKKKKVQE